ncbi:MAG: hypothetical protein NZM15_03060 [Flavobacteriales bacterium]|nr:hypothetical protein [Flavobacteriales bacterium]MDW8431666.1 hypothetical protein [Flavobacteriales bacterium]
MKKILIRIGQVLFWLLVIGLAGVMTGFLFPERLVVHGHWSIPCNSDTIRAHLRTAQGLSAVLPFMEDAERYTKIPYGSQEKNAGVAWYARETGHLKAYAEFLKESQDSGVFVGLNFREKGKALMRFLPRAAADGTTQLEWHYEARFGNNPIARFFGFELRPLVTRTFSSVPSEAVSELCQ